jgi:CubicO group peptidase (beta-lactamase class C family)
MQGKLKLHGRLVDYLPLSAQHYAASRSEIESICISQLLNHSHGLDDSLESDLPRTARGFVDSDALCRNLYRHPFLVPPGVAYNYGSGGYWLAAAVLESCYDIAYAQLVRKQIDDVLSHEGKTPAASLTNDICPSMGGSLALNAEQLLAMVRVHMRAGSGADIYSALRAERAKYPGWCPTNKGSTCGWNDYGDGWYGHSSYSRGQSAVVRFNVERDTAVVITSQKNQATQLLAALFGEILPEFAAQALVERPVRKHEDHSETVLGVAGEYANAAELVRLEKTGLRNRPLRLRIASSLPNRTEQTTQVANLIMASEGVMYASPPIGQFQFVQPCRLEATEVASHIWNGSRLWRRRLSA